MFDITGDDIQRLDDADLRTLVARLALAEFADRGLPQSAITAGGLQEAKDGGIDVRVDCEGPLVRPDFVPRPKTGFQVKKPDMPRQAIRDEMRPKGVLRSTIADLAEAGGAYIIASAKGSVADTPLGDRKQAMKDALAGHKSASRLLVDFYDRERLANWSNIYPGVVAWLRGKVAGELSGWRPIGEWFGSGTRRGAKYLVDDASCLIHETSGDRSGLEVLDGINRLRGLLNEPRQCVRLVGTSGVGKTRLVDALFENDVGENALEPAISVYADFADDTVPSARAMAQRLVDAGARAILVVDNCNPTTHSQLAKICSAARSKVSLITVEYDVRDDEPESTEVFRLTSAPVQLIEDWLKREFEYVSQVDRHRIAAFSDGNFRIARALAQTLKHGETLGELRDRHLFERIFHQRNEPDRQLLRDAEFLALLYSFDGENEAPDSELARLAAFAERSVLDLFGSIGELRRRRIIQSRGRWRALLPQAIANWLAAEAVEKIPPGAFDRFCASLPFRMLRSISRRLGFLHTSGAAQDAVDRWLRADGPLGDLLSSGELGLSILGNIAPVAPNSVLDLLAEALGGADGSSIRAVSNGSRGQWTELLASLAYESSTFVLATNLLACFVAAEPPGHNVNSTRPRFEQLFHLYLSGTHASAAQRREVVRSLCTSDDPDQQRVGAVALEALLATSLFSSAASLGFGARPRDFGWHPSTYGDAFDWYNGAIDLVLELRDEVPDGASILARSVRGLWKYGGCHETLEKAGICIAEDGGWIDGWIAFRATLSFDGQHMPEDVRARLLAIIDRLKPIDLIDQARAYVLSRPTGGYEVVDFVDGKDVSGAWNRASQRAIEIGRAMVEDRSLLTEFLTEVIAQDRSSRAHEFGRGLALGAEDLGELWANVVGVYLTAQPEARNPTVLGGLLREAQEIDSEFASSRLTSVAGNTDLAHLLPYLQVQIAIDEEGLLRLASAARARSIAASAFSWLSLGGAVKEAPSEPFAEMLRAVADLENGATVALSVLHHYLHFAFNAEKTIAANVVSFGRELLKRAEIAEMEVMHDYEIGKVAEYCLSGPEAAEDAAVVCERLRSAYNDHRASKYCNQRLIQALFLAQPEVALDCFLLSQATGRALSLVRSGVGGQSPLERLDSSVLCAWADKEPAKRYALLGSVLPIFSGDASDESKDISPLFLEVLDKTPHRGSFLSECSDVVPSSGWSGSLALILEKRRGLLSKLSDHPDREVQRWLRRLNAELDDRMRWAHEMEISHEESFE